MAELATDWRLYGFIAGVGGYLVLIKMLIRDVGTLKRWQGYHEREATEIRLNLQADIGKLRESNARTEEKFIAILDKLEALTRALDRRDRD